MTKEELDSWQESDRSGREYERLVCRVMRELFKDALVSARRNEVLYGASGAGYEIDLLMDLSFRGKKCFVAVECKDYARPVGKEKVEAFCSVLRDLNASKRRRRKLTGIMVSSGGFQSGAVKLAGYGRVILLELRRPGEKEWRNYVRRFLSGYGKLDLSMRTNEKVKVLVDEKRFAGRLPWKMGTPLAYDEHSLMFEGKSLAEMLMEGPGAGSEIVSAGGVRRTWRVPAENGFLRHLVWDGGLPIRGLEFSYDDLTEDAKDAILYRRDKPDLVLSDPVRGWSAGIWDWKAVRLPDGAVF